MTHLFDKIFIRYYTIKILEVKKVIRVTGAFFEAEIIKLE